MLVRGHFAAGSSPVAASMVGSARRLRHFVFLTKSSGFAATCQKWPVMALSGPSSPQIRPSPKSSTNTSAEWVANGKGASSHSADSRATPAGRYGRRPVPPTPAAAAATGPRGWPSCRTPRRWVSGSTTSASSAPRGSGPPRRTRSASRRAFQSGDGRVRGLGGCSRVAAGGSPCHGLHGDCTRRAIKRPLTGLSASQGPFRGCSGDRI